MSISLNAAFSLAFSFINLNILFSNDACFSGLSSISLWVVKDQVVGWAFYPNWF